MEGNNIAYLEPEQALMFVSQKEDLLNSGLKYFTCIPSRNSVLRQEGWEDVLYFNGRRKEHSVEMSPDCQYVYILTNRVMPGLIKIGYTDKTPKIRAAMLSKATGVPAKFEVVWSFPCFNGIRLEEEVHRKLSEYRVARDREFFNIPIEQAKLVIQELGQKYQFIN